jgi:hypothetical protein
MHGDRRAKAPSSITIKKAENGGYITTHHYDNFGAGESYMPSKDHAFSDYDAAEKHTRKHLGGKGDPAKRDGFGGASTGAGGRPQTGDKAPAPSKQTGTGTKKAAAPSRRSYGAGVD